jgi:hypothetical protein
MHRLVTAMIQPKPDLTKCLAVGFGVVGEELCQAAVGEGVAEQTEDGAQRTSYHMRTSFGAFYNVETVAH